MLTFFDHEAFGARVLQRFGHRRTHCRLSSGVRMQCSGAPDAVEPVAATGAELVIVKGRIRIEIARSTSLPRDNGVYLVDLLDHPALVSLLDSLTAPAGQEDSIAARCRV